MKRKTKLILLSAWLAGSLVKADIISLATTPGGMGSNDTVLWGQLGADGTLIPNTFAATSTGGKAIGGAFSTTTGLVAQVGASWGPASGTFANNDRLIWSFDAGATAGTGPVTFTFPAGFAAGASIQADTPGQFTAKVELFNASNTSLGFVTETSDANGDAIFIGAVDATAANVAKAVFSLTAAQSNSNETNNLGDFALDTLNLQNTETVTTPEPGTMFLMGGALIGLACRLRRRTARG